jgi:hypothetical protein
MTQRAIPVAFILRDGTKARGTPREG